MFAAKLIQLIEAHADKLADHLMQNLKQSSRCQTMLLRIPPGELRKRVQEIYQNLSDWLSEKSESEIEERYIGLGVRRARQGVPFSEFLWALGATKECLWEYLQREGLQDDPTDLWGEVDLRDSIERFFDRAAYFAAMGYESAGEQTSRASAERRKSRHK